MQRTVSVGDKRLTRKLSGRPHLAAGDGVAGSGDKPEAAVAGDTGVPDVTAALLGSNLYGTLCGAKNKGPFWPQADKLAKASKTGMAVMIRNEDNID